MLVLFDIDGTLITSQRVGVHAMTDAGRELFGDGFGLDGLEISGRLDGQIWLDAARRAGVADPDAHGPRFRETYGRHLRTRLERDRPARLLPGVAELIDALDGRRATVGLLTGNWPETGRLKIAAAGLDPERFPIAAWGSDGAHRRDLPPVAMERFAAAHGRALRAEQVVIIGDTPNDVDCARHHGCRVIATATGIYARDALLAAGADLALDDLSGTAAILEWLVDSLPVVSEE